MRATCIGYINEHSSRWVARSLGQLLHYHLVVLAHTAVLLGSPVLQYFLVVNQPFKVPRS